MLWYILGDCILTVELLKVNPYNAYIWTHKLNRISRIFYESLKTKILYYVNQYVSLFYMVLWFLQLIHRMQIACNTRSSLTTSHIGSRYMQIHYVFFSFFLVHFWKQEFSILWLRRHKQFWMLARIIVYTTEHHSVNESINFIIFFL